MFFWIGVAVVFVVFVGVVTWGVRGIAGRAHEPGTQHLTTVDRHAPSTGAASVRSVVAGRR